MRADCGSISKCNVYHMDNFKIRIWLISTSATEGFIKSKHPYHNGDF